MQCSLSTALLFAAFTLTGCSHCAVCYQDAWSREPFPGQAKQHIAPVDPRSIPDDVPAPGPLALPPA